MPSFVHVWVACRRVPAGGTEDQSWIGIRSANLRPARPKAAHDPGPQQDCQGRKQEAEKRISQIAPDAVGLSEQLRCNHSAGLACDEFLSRQNHPLVPGDDGLSRPRIPLLVRFDIARGVRLFKQIEYAERLTVRPFRKSRPTIEFRQARRPLQSHVPHPCQRKEEQTARKASTPVQTHTITRSAYSPQFLCGDPCRRLQCEQREFVSL